MSNYIYKIKCIILYLLAMKTIFGIAGVLVCYLFYFRFTLRTLCPEDVDIDFKMVSKVKEYAAM